MFHTYAHIYVREKNNKAEREGKNRGPNYISFRLRLRWLIKVSSFDLALLYSGHGFFTGVVREKEQTERGRKEKREDHHDFPRTSSRLSFGGCTLSTVPRLSFFEGGSSKVVWGDLIDSPSAPRTLPPDHSIYFGAEPLANIISRFPYERTSLSFYLSLVLYFPPRQSCERSGAALI